MTDIKEHNIRSIDEKINSIMKKHIKVDNEQINDERIPLGNKNHNEPPIEPKKSYVDFGSENKKSSLIKNNYHF